MPGSGSPAGGSWTGELAGYAREGIGGSGGFSGLRPGQRAFELADLVAQQRGFFKFQVVCRRQHFFLKFLDRGRQVEILHCFLEQ